MWLSTAASGRLRATMGSTQRGSPPARTLGDKSEPRGVIDPAVIIGFLLPVQRDKPSNRRQVPGLRRAGTKISSFVYYPPRSDDPTLVPCMGTARRQPISTQCPEQLSNRSFNWRSRRPGSIREPRERLRVGGARRATLPGLSAVQNHFGLRLFCPEEQQKAPPSLTGLRSICKHFASTNHLTLRERPFRSQSFDHYATANKKPRSDRSGGAFSIC
jgi:hypothetical protein